MESSQQSGTQYADVIIVGTGIAGLSAARTYLELAPCTSLIVLESNSTLGGVWAEHNLYEGLKTNNLLGMYEWPDFPMTGKYDVKEDEHIPGDVVHKYLIDFAHHFGIYQRIQFNTRVLEVEKVDSGWMLTAVGNAQINNQPILYHCNKLLLCTGLASKAHDISIPGQDTFDKPLMNQKGLHSEGQRLAESPKVETVAVTAASKSGYDAVYLFASHGKKVDWILKNPAVWMAYPQVTIGPIQTTFERLAQVRFMTWLSPCIWGVYDGFNFVRKFFHQTKLGRFLVHNIWESIRTAVVDNNGYRKDTAIADLEPPDSMFWTARVGMLNYPTDFHNYIRNGQVRIHKGTISHLSENGTINFTDKRQLNTDGLVIVTGWDQTPTIKFKPDGLDASLGIPSTTYSAEEKAFWKYLEDQADKQILQQFPYLRNLPPNEIPYKKYTPFRLYRGIAPPGLTTRSDRSLVFIKMVHSTANHTLIELQSLWSYAYLNNKLDIDEDNVYWRTALMSRFGRWRYPLGFGRWYPEFVFDMMPYADMLLTDLGLRKRRKSTMFKEWFEPYTVFDYTDIRKEWKEAQVQRKLRDIE